MPVAAELETDNVSAGAPEPATILALNRSPTPVGKPIGRGRGGGEAKSVLANWRRRTATERGLTPRVPPGYKEPRLACPAAFPLTQRRRRPITGNQNPLELEYDWRLKYRPSVTGDEDED